MSDEIDQFILAIPASAAAEEPPKRRGIFRRKRRSKLPEKPLTHCENCGAPLSGRVLLELRTARDRLPAFLSGPAGRAADSFFNWDTKFLKTLGLLLIRPLGVNEQTSMPAAVPVTFTRFASI